jgi:hypothetical protein
MEFEKIKFEHLQFTRAKEPHPVANFRMLLTAEHVETLGYSALMNGTVVKDQFGDIPIPFKIDSALIYLPDPVNPDSTDRYPADAVKGLKLKRTKDAQYELWFTAHFPATFRYALVDLHLKYKDGDMPMRIETRQGELTEDDGTKVNLSGGQVVDAEFRDPEVDDEQEPIENFRRPAAEPEVIRAPRGEKRRHRIPQASGSTGSAATAH